MIRLLSEAGVVSSGLGIRKELVTEAVCLGSWERKQGDGQKPKWCTERKPVSSLLKGPFIVETKLDSFCWRTVVFCLKLGFVVTLLIIYPDKDLLDIFFIFVSWINFYLCICKLLKIFFNSYPVKYFENCHSTNFLGNAGFYSRLGTSGESKKNFSSCLG